MSTAVDNSEVLTEMVSNLTSTVDDHGTDAPVPEAAGVDEVAAYEAHQAMHAPDAEPPVPEADDAEAEAETDLTGQKRVPLQALQAERRQRQELQRQLQQQAEANQQLAQQWQAFVAQQQAQQQAAMQAQQQQLPDFAEDPQAHVEALQQQVQQLQQTEQQRQQAAQQEHRVRQTISQNAAQLAAEVGPVEAAFRAEHQDYDHAIDHLSRHADAAIAAKYPGTAPQQRDAIKALALAEFVAECARGGRNPAQTLYQEAVRQGFQPGGATRAQPGATRLDQMNLADVARLDDAAFDELFEGMRRAGIVGPRL